MEQNLPKIMDLGPCGPCGVTIYDNSSFCSMVLLHKNLVAMNRFCSIVLCSGSDQTFVHFHSIRPSKYLDSQISACHFGKPNISQTISSSLSKTNKNFPQGNPLVGQTSVGCQQWTEQQHNHHGPQQEAAGKVQKN